MSGACVYMQEATEGSEDGKDTADGEKSQTTSNVTPQEPVVAKMSPMQRLVYQEEQVL